MDEEDDWYGGSYGPSVVRRAAGGEETVRANRAWWDDNADDYQAEHGQYLGDARFLWCPEGLDEAEAGLLGPVAGKRVLEVGCGAAQCARWLAGQGALVAGFDLSLRQLELARRIDQHSIDQHRVEQPVDTGNGAESLPGPLPLVVADASAVPFADDSFDIACSAFGAVPFVADSAAVMREICRVLKPGGRWVFAVPHPFRWCLPDDPGENGLVVRDSYFDRRPYVEQDDSGVATYVEHHRTFGDRVSELTAAGLMLRQVVEPEYPRGLGDRWGGGWSEYRGRLVPGTAIFIAEKPSAQPTQVSTQ
ncbi:MAG TPA: class I SAM-dependent methyltransferase [Actinocrinis sp.]